MAKRTKKKAVTGAGPDPRKNQVKRLYLEHLGKISNSELSRRTGVHRVTIQKWKDEGNWEKLATEVEHKTDKRMTETTAKKYADKISPMFDEILGNLKLLSHAARQLIMTLDEHGRPVVDSNGAPVINPKLTASDIRALTSSMGEYQRVLRLQLGQSTENTTNRISGEMTTVHKDEWQFRRAMEQIVKTGDAEGQAALAEMIKNRQKIMERAGGDTDE